jgi:putative phosphoesterase
LRIAIVSDIHSNLTALEAVLADLREVSPDLILHGGDLVSAGSRPVEIVDIIRDLGWQGVVGNTDELMFRPESLREFFGGAPIGEVIDEMAAFERDALGAERLSWLRGLPFKLVEGPMALVHASPESCWRGPMPEATDAELEKVYSPLGQAVVVYGHIHRSFIRRLAGMTVVNAGSVSLSHDGDRRASYVLLDDQTPTIRRVEWNLDRELRSLAECGLPHADWVARMLASGRPEMP